MLRRATNKAYHMAPEDLDVLGCEFLVQAAEEALRV